MQKLIDGQFVDCTQADLVNGDVYRIPVGNGGWQQQQYITPDKEAEERIWRDSELSRTDLMLQPDRPNYQAILDYRALLRDYPSHPDFPNGVRPTL